MQNVESTKSRYRLWRSLIENTKISHGAFRLWHYLHSHSDSEGKCWPGHRTIAKKIGCNIQSVSGWVHELVEAEWLQVENKGDGERNYYTLLNGLGRPLKGENRIEKPSRRRNGKQTHSVTKNHDEPLRIPALKDSKKENGSEVADSPTSTSSPAAPSERGRSEASVSQSESPLTGSDRFAADQACKKFIERIPADKLTDAIKAKVREMVDWSAGQMNSGTFTSDEVMQYAEGLLIGTLPKALEPAEDEWTATE